MSKPVQVVYLIDDKTVMRVMFGGALNAEVVCAAVSREWAGTIARALQAAQASVDKRSR